MAISVGDHVRRAVFQRSFHQRSCAHVAAIDVVEPSGATCADCVAEGTRTVHLRMCLTCGNVGCCGSSRPSHARRHHEETGHPVIRSIEPREQWAWCYVDRAYLPSIV
jgi:uncharacterized UBP type Zn finger protein